MKTSVILFFSLLIFSFSALAGKEAGCSCSTQAVSGAEQTVVSKPIPAVSSGHFDFFAVETVQQSVPAPLRVMRKLSDKSQRINPEGLDACLGQYFSWAQFHRANSVEVVLDGHSAEPLHNADYIKFGILII